MIRTLEVIIRAKGLTVPELSPETRLDSDLGLESLDFAELVIRLEDELGQDPFAKGTPPAVRTVSDLAALYDLPQ